MSSTRNLTLDVAKGISILLMTISHLTIFQENQTISSFNTNYLFFFRLPLFIFISGLLFIPQDKVLKFAYNKFDGLIKPIVTLFIAFVVIVTVFGIFKGDGVGDAYAKADIIFQNLFYPLWFPITLFFALFLYNLIMYFRYNHDKRLTTFVTLSVLLLAVGLYFIDLKSKLLVINTIIIFLYLLAVGFTVKSNQFIDVLYKPLTLLTSILTLIICLYYKESLGIRLDLYHNIFGKFIPTTLTLLAAIVVVLNLAKQISKVPVLAKTLALCSKASFYILAFHIIIGNKILYPIVNKILGKSIISNCLQYIVMITLCIAIYKIVFYIPIVKKLMLPKKALKTFSE